MVSEPAVCSTSRVAGQDSLEEQEDCLPWEKSAVREPAVLPWIGGQEQGEGVYKKM